MEYRQHSLRTLALKLNVSGTAEVLDETRLYQGGYGFIKLQIYAPKTQNTEAPLCTVFKTTVDELGREKVSGVNHNLVCAGEYALDGEIYLLFENYLPKSFTEIAGDLKITVNYYDTAPTLDSDGNTLYDVNGVPLRHATALLISNQYVTKVEKGGYNADGVKLAINSAEAAQINDNTLRIISLEYDVSGLHNNIDIAVDEIHAQYELVVDEGGKLVAASAESARNAARSATEASEQTEEARKILAKTNEFSAAAANSEINAENWAKVAKSFAQFGVKINTDYCSLSDLPQPGNAQYLFLIPNGSEGSNSYDEYIWTDTKQAYEKLGTTQIDLTDYATKVELTAAVQEEAKARENALLPKADKDGTYPDMTVGKALNIKAVDLQIAVSSWLNNVATTTVDGVTSTATVQVIFDDDSAAEVINCDVEATSTGDGSVTFTCVQTPTIAISATLIIIN